MLLFTIIFICRKNFAKILILRYRRYLIYQYSILVIENFDAKKFYIKYKITIILELKILRKKLICLLRYEDQMELIDQLFYCQQISN